MKIHYFPDTDALYIDLRNEPSTESEEIAPDVVADYNTAGQIVGISIDSASTKVDLTAVDISDLPHVRVHSTPAQTPEAVAVGASAAHA